MFTSFYTIREALPARTQRDAHKEERRKCGLPLRAHHTSSVHARQPHVRADPHGTVTDGFRGAQHGSHARSPSAPSAPSARTHIQLARSPHSSPGTRHSRSLHYSPRAPCPLITHKTSTRHGHTIVPTRMFRPEGLPPTRSLGNNAPSTTVRSLHSALSSPHPPARPHRPTTLLVRRASAPGVCAVCLRRARLTPRRAASCSSGSVRVLRA